MKNLTTFFFGLLLSLISFSVYAVPACPQPIEFTQPDGSKVTILLKGDEKVKWAETDDGYTIIFNRKGFYEYAVLNTASELEATGVIAKNREKRTPRETSYLNKIEKHATFSSKQVSYLRSIQQIYTAEAEKVFPTSGTRNLICILMGFKDLPFSKTQTNFNNLFNQVNYTADGATGSVKDFYIENSYGQLDLNVTVAGPFVSNNDMAYYGGNNTVGDDSNPRALVTEAVQKANATVNYANFDNDNDGSVDGVYVIFAGFGEEAGAPANAIWSHAWNIPTLTLDGKTISRYSCSPELRGNSGTGITRIGVICHEFGHVLGSPDFYDIDYATNGSYAGTGKWDLMAVGSWNNNGATPAHHNAYTKTMVYHWATPTLLNSDSQTTLYNAAENANSYYRFNTTTANEYFLIENRQQTKFDTYLPGHGMIIYHVDGNYISAPKGGINAGSHQGMYPVFANATGNPPDTYGSINSAGCPFPGTGNKTSFTDVSTPSAKSWAGANTGKPITSIVENNTSKTVSFSMSAGIYYAVPGIIQAENYSTMAGIQKETTTDTGGGENIGYTDTGDYLDYLVNVISAGSYTIDFRVASGVATGKIELRNQAGTTLATLVQGNTGGWQTWVTKRVNANLTAGKQTLRIYYSGAGLNLNWFEIKPVESQVLTSITVTPATATINVGQSQQYTATGKDQNGAVMAITPNWTTTGGGTISSTGLLTATTAGGPFTVSATVVTISGTAQVTVTPAPVLTTITVSPATTTITQGQTQQFTAVGKDQFGTVMTISPTWSANAPNGLFTATTAGGPFTVSATVGAVSGTAHVTVDPAPVSQVIQAENYATMYGVQTETTSDVGGGLNVGWIAAGDWMTYIVTIPQTGTYSANFRVAGWTATSTFALQNAANTTLASVTAPNGGTGANQVWSTVAGSNNFNLTAGTQTLRIYATGPSWNLNWFEIKAVEASVLTTITVSPATATIVSGLSQQFTAVGKDQFGTVMPITPTWSSNAPNGLFTGSTVGGPYTVTASVGAISGSAQVTVTTPTTITTLNPTADAYVRGGTYAATNYGTTADLLVKSAPETDGLYSRRAYLKFSVEGITGVQNAVVRLYAGTVAAFSVKVNETTDAWTETAINWNNAPVAGNLIATTAVTAAGAYYEWNVTSYVQSQATGDGIVSLVFSDVATTNTQIIFNSKEATANKPQLVVTSNGSKSANVSSDIQEVSNKELKLYPNPVSDELHVQNADQNSTIEVFNLTGKLVMTKKLENSNIVNVSSLESGLYILKATGNEKTSLIKFIKK
jgi:M6 family metalloprotease-like protein